MDCIADHNTSQKAEVTVLKELIVKLTVQYKLSEEKRKALLNKVAKLKDNCKINYDKLLNSERNRLLAEYNLFISEKKIRKLESHIKKMMGVKKANIGEKESSIENNMESVSYTHPDDELTGMKPSKVSADSENTSSYLASLTELGLAQGSEDDLDSGICQRSGGYESRDRQILFTSFPEFYGVAPNSDMSSINSISIHRLLLREALTNGCAEGQNYLPLSNSSGESVKSTQEEVDKLSSRLQVLKSFSAERGRELEEKKSAIKEKEKLVKSVREEIAKIREIIKLKESVYK